MGDKCSSEAEPLSSLRREVEKHHSGPRIRQFHLRKIQSSLCPPADRQVEVETVICLPPMDVIELLREKLVPALMPGTVTRDLHAPSGHPCYENMVVRRAPRSWSFPLPESRPRAVLHFCCPQCSPCCLGALKVPQNAA